MDLTGLLNVYSYPGSPVIVVYTRARHRRHDHAVRENDRVEWRAPRRDSLGALAFDSTREALREWVAARGLTPGG